MDGDETSEPISAAQAEAQEQAGIPKGWAFSRICYNPPTKSTVLLCRRGNSSRLLGTLFYKAQSEARFRCLSEFFPGSFVSSLAVSQTKPDCFFNVHSYQDGRGRWSGVYVLDLERHQTRPLVGESDLTLPSPFSRVTVFDIADVQPDSSGLYCTACLLEETHKVQDNYLVPVGGYFLVDLNIDRKSVKILNKIDIAFL